MTSYEASGETKEPYDPDQAWWEYCAGNLGPTGQRAFEQSTHDGEPTEEKAWGEAARAIIDRAVSDGVLVWNESHALNTGGDPGAASE